MWSILFWIVVGMFIGWNLPQPAWAKALQDKAVAAIRGSTGHPDRGERETYTPSSSYPPQRRKH